MARYDIGDVSLTLDELRKQTNVDFDDDNEYLEQLGRVAISQVFHATRRTVEELKEMGGGKFPEELRLAALQLVDHWYRVRASVTTLNQSAVPFGLDFLVKPFVKLGVRNDR